jgi:Recombination endonuclease VII
MVDLEKRRARQRINQRRYRAANRDKERAYRRAYRVANLDKERARNATYAAAIRDKALVNKRAHYAANRHKVRAHYLEGGRARMRKNKGLPEPTRPEPAMCEICAWPRMESRALCLDHDHHTGLFRGWLCFRCNSGIGLLGDDLASLRRAVVYLEKNS